MVKANFPADIYLLNVNNSNIKIMCEICSKLTMKTPERRQWRRSGVFIVNLNKFHVLFWCFIVEFRQVNASWVAEHLSKIKSEIKSSNGIS